MPLLLTRSLAVSCLLAAASLPVHAEMPGWPRADTLDRLYDVGSPSEVVAAGVLASIGAGVAQVPAEDFFFKVLDREPAHVLAANGLLIHCARRPNVPLCSNTAYLREMVGNDEANGAMWVAYAAATYNNAGAAAALPLVQRAAKTPRYDSFGPAYMALFNELLLTHAPVLPTHHQQLMIGYSGAMMVEIRLYQICQAETAEEWTAACLALGRHLEADTRSPSIAIVGHKFQLSMLEQTGDRAAAKAIEQRREALLQSTFMPNPSEYFHEKDSFWYELADTQVYEGERAGARLVRDRIAGRQPIDRTREQGIPDAITDQVAEGLVVAATVRSRASEFIITEERAPASRAEAGIAANPKDSYGKYVSSVDIADGQIIVTYGNNADERIRGLTLVLTPYTSGTMSLSWQCGYSSPPPGGSPIGKQDLSSSVPPDLMPCFCRP